MRHDDLTVPEEPAQESAAAQRANFVVCQRQHAGKLDVHVVPAQRLEPSRQGRVTHRVHVQGLSLTHGGWRVWGGGRRGVKGGGWWVQDVGWWVQGTGCRVQGVGCRVQGVGYGVQGDGCRVHGDGCGV